MKTQISRIVLVAAVTVGLFCAVTKTVQADEWNDHQQHARDWHDKHFHHHHDHDRPTVIEEPNVVYAPPVVVEPPPAPADDAPSGLNLIFPINIH